MRLVFLLFSLFVQQDARFVTALSQPRHFEPPTALTGRIFVSKSDLDVRTGLLKQREAQLAATGESLSIMCVGESGTGKSTLIANIFTAPITRSSESRSSDVVGGPTLAIVESHLSLDCEGIPLKIKIIDTPGKCVVLIAGHLRAINGACRLWGRHRCVQKFPSDRRVHRQLLRSRACMGAGP